MKKWKKVLFLILGSVVVLLSIALIIGTATIDTTPYFKTDYYKNTLAQMDSVVKHKTTDKDSLLAGFARINITPTLTDDSPNVENGEFSGIKMAGYGDGKIAVGVHDSLFAKAVAVTVGSQKIVLISADLALIPEPVVLDAEEKLKHTISRKQLYFGATHTHSSIGNCLPGFVGKSFGGDYNPEVVEWLGTKIATLVKNALADQRPATFASGYIRVPDLVRNRIIGETGRLNDKLDLLSFVQDNGKKATIGAYSAHATVIGTFNDRFSGDYPGYFQRHLEADGTDLALFFAGTVGSHSNKGEGEKFEKAKYIGETLADSAKVLVNRLDHTSLMTLTAMTTELEIPELQFLRITDRLRLSPYVGRKLIPKMESVYLQGLQMNDLIWLALPYELSGEYGLDLKNALELEGYNSVLSSFNGQYLGYIVPQKYYYYDTYEARLMGWYGPSMGDYLMELNFRMANELTHSKL